MAQLLGLPKADTIRCVFDLAIAIEREEAEPAVSDLVVVSPHRPNESTQEGPGAGRMVRHWKHSQAGGTSYEGGSTWHRNVS